MGLGLYLSSSRFRRHFILSSVSSSCLPSLSLFPASPSSLLARSSFLLNLTLNTTYIPFNCLEKREVDRDEEEGVSGTKIERQTESKSFWKWALSSHFSLHLLLSLSLSLSSNSIQLNSLSVYFQVHTMNEFVQKKEQRREHL